MQYGNDTLRELPPGTMRILCVEDEPELLDDLATELIDHGFAAEKAPDGRQALDLLAAGGFDLVICDMRLPGMSGLDVMVEHSARTEAQGRPPFIFLTAYADETTRREALAGGAADFIVKPVDYRHLLDRVGQLLER